MFHSHDSSDNSSDTKSSFSFFSSLGCESDTEETKKVASSEPATEVESNPTQDFFTCLLKDLEDNPLIESVCTPSSDVDKRKNRLITPIATPTMLGRRPHNSR